MFKRTLAMIAGVALLATATTDSQAAGLSDIETGLLIESADPFLTVLAAPTGDGAALDLLGTFSAGGTSVDGDNVTISNPSGSFDLLVLESVPLFDTLLTGTEEDSAYTESTSGEDLLEILFSVSGSLNSAPFVLATITGDFGSDPLGISGLSTLSFLGDPAKITLTAVNQVPLPAGLVLLLSALGGLVLVRRRTA